MATPIYKNEQAWRAYMLLGQSSIRAASNNVSETIAAALLIYLVSTYSVPIAIGLAVILLCALVWHGQQKTKSMQNLLSLLEEDAELDL